MSGEHSTLPIMQRKEGLPPTADWLERGGRGVHPALLTWLERAGRLTCRRNLGARPGAWLPAQHCRHFPLAFPYRCAVPTNRHSHRLPSRHSAYLHWLLPTEGNCKGPNHPCKLLHVSLALLASAGLPSTGA